MHFRENLNDLAAHQRLINAVRVPCFWGLALLSVAAGAQTAPAAPASTPLPATAISAVVAPQTWSALSKSQQLALAPLEKPWGGLSEGQKRKWLAIAKTYPTLGVPEQEKMHSRMAEWAALSPKDRELARLNFAQSKTVTQSDRAANWEAYQALSPGERQKLAEGAKAKPVGAAIAVKPVTSDKLTAVPVTRHTTEQERAAATSLRPLNRSTLLPRPAASATDAAAVPSKP
jgi:Protein of unknown function (DUF3106)